MRNLNIFKIIFLCLCFIFAFDFTSSNLFVSQLNAQSLDTNYFRNYKPRNIGPAGMSGRVTSIDVNMSDKSKIFVGTASGGVWFSESGGINWEPIFDKMSNQSIGAIKIQQTNPDVIWVGTGEGNPRNSQCFGDGIYKSIDGGKSWNKKGLENSKSIHRIIIHKDNPEIVYVGVMGITYGENEERGVFKTIDGGKTWKKILYLTPNTGCADLVVDPINPNKMFASMYEYKRFPWNYKSGGKSSGLYVTYDGGDNWTNLTDKSYTEGKNKNGLPTGEIGRIGIAIANNNNKIVYATIESEKNALYRSEDGGVFWKMVNDKEVGDRPFYYAEIYVDPQNENRIYDIASIVKYSVDGGKSFKTLLPYWGIHPDHHSFWIDKDNPKFMIDGNDGGLAITYDKGENWRFIENIPVAQFYHINYDMEIPYNVYGGMQDNGSWRGPSEVWAGGGIRNYYWKELLFGDGFDVVPDKSDNRYGYAMWQGGNLSRFDIITGITYNIKPMHPDNIELRFHWNSAILADNFDNKTLYYGSQFVHKSTDRGENWTIISPDLTTNDSTKQIYDKSGGLTEDVTGAETHTTILAISQSPINKNILWVGTDDGNIQITSNGGLNWDNTSNNLKSIPQGSWVPQIIPSNYNENEAFAVINNYRRNDWKPYLMHTKDKGKSWVNLSENKGISSFCLSFTQDAVTPELMFLGTDEGLYVSLNAGKVWTKWTNGFPSCPTIDLKIHPRENDLIVGTFGRAAWIFDDISFLRDYILKNKNNNTNRIILSKINKTINHNYSTPPGVRFAGDANFSGQNKQYGAKFHLLIDKNLDAKKDSLLIANSKKSIDSIYINIYNDKNEQIRFIRAKVDSGYNRISWDLREKGFRNPGSKQIKVVDSDPSGLNVLPGNYKVVVEYVDSKDSQNVEIEYDNRLPTNIEEYKQQLLFANEIQNRSNKLTEISDRITETEELIKHFESQVSILEDSLQKDVNKKITTFKDSLKNIKSLIFFSSEKQGIVRRPDVLNDNLYNAFSYIGEAMSIPNSTHKIALQKVDLQLNEVTKKINMFFEQDYKKFKEEMNKLKFDPFKEYKPINSK